MNRYLNALRQRIAEYCERESPFSGEIEVDEIYFEARRVKGVRGRGALGKTIVFGILKHGTNDFANSASHINGIESYWAYAKTKLYRFRGMKMNTFLLHLKECEFRFYNRRED